MKTQLTPEEVARRATSPEAALDVSREVWVGRAEMSEKELKELLLGSDMCGLCQWYGVDETAGCQRYRRGPCVLEEKRGCCSEYYKASEVLGAYQRGNTTEAQVRSAFWAMVARLDAERAKLPKESKCDKPAIRHGDYGEDDGEFFVVTAQSHEPKAFFENGNGQVNMNGSDGNKPNQFNYDVYGNIFDDLAAMREDVEQYEYDKHCKHWMSAEISGDCIFVKTSPYGKSIEPKDLDDFILKLRQIKATLERRAKNEDC